MWSVEVDKLIIGALSVNFHPVQAGVKYIVTVTMQKNVFCYTVNFLQK